MAGQRNHDTAEFKTTVALAASKGQHTGHEMAATDGVHPSQALQWKKQALEALPTSSFSTRRGRVLQEEEARQARLYQQIGQLRKSRSTGSHKQLDDPLEHRRHGVEPPPEQISGRRPGQWLGLNRSGWYSHPVDASVEHLHRRRSLDEPYPRGPLSGVLRLTAWLHHQGDPVKAKRVRRLVRQWG